MRKILITGGELENKGAQSMVFITVDELHKRFPDHEIVVISPFDVKRSKEEKSNYKFKIDDMHSLVPILKKTSLKHRIYYLLKGYDRVAYQEAVDFYSQVDMLVDISGYALGSDWNILYVDTFLYRIMLGKIFGFRVFLMPQSFGPFDYKGSKGKAIRRNIKKWLKHCDKICAREQEGFDYLTKDFKLNNVVKTYDLVLNNKGIDLRNIYYNIPKLKIPDIKQNSIAIIPNFKNSDFGNVKEIFAFYKETIDLILEKGKTVYVLRHSKNDIDLCRQIVSMFAGYDKVILLEQDFSCLEFDEMVNKFDFIIASRYHSVVHSYKNYVPSITLGWAVKYRELHAFFDQSDFCFNVRGNLDKQKILNKIEYMMDNHKTESAKIKEKIVAAQSYNVFDILSLE